MAYTTCTFWIKFFLFWGITAGIGTLLMTIMCPPGVLGTPCGTIIFILTGLIHSPILFANQIYNKLIKKQFFGKKVDQITNKAWLEENFDFIGKQYVNQFVAIRDLQIIDSDENLNLLKERIKQRRINLNKVYIQFIKSKEEKDFYDKIGRKV
jgi:hypothetical protein